MLKLKAPFSIFTVIRPHKIGHYDYGDVSWVYWHIFIPHVYLKSIVCNMLREILFLDLIGGRIIGCSICYEEKCMVARLYCMF